MEPLSRASLLGIHDYVAGLEVERGLITEDLASQCLKLGAEVAELLCAVRKFQGYQQDPDAG
jgi:hypothetical protein